MCRRILEFTVDHILCGIQCSLPSPPVQAPPTCKNANAATICQSQGCCDYDCDNLPNGFVQSGVNGVTCQQLPSQRCCLGTNGCGYYCTSPPPSSPCVQNTDCACVGSACREAITSVSSATDCYGNCFAECIGNALGGICSGSAEAANFAPALVFSPSCDSVLQDTCVIDFAQPTVTQCQTSTGCGPSPPPSSPSGNCPTTIASLGPASCGSIPGVQNVVDCQLQGYALVAYHNSNDQLPCGSIQPDLCGQTTFPNAAYWCDYCTKNPGGLIDGSCFNTYFDVANQPLCASYVGCPQASFAPVSRVSRFS